MNKLLGEQLVRVEWEIAKAKSKCNEYKRTIKVVEGLLKDKEGRLRELESHFDSSGS